MHIIILLLLLILSTVLSLSLYPHSILTAPLLEPHPCRARPRRAAQATADQGPALHQPQPSRHAQGVRGCGGLSPAEGMVCNFIHYAAWCAPHPPAPEHDHYETIPKCLPSLIRPIHIAWLRCSSSAYCFEYASSSLLALLAPRTPSSVRPFGIVSKGRHCFTAKR